MSYKIPFVLGFACCEGTDLMTTREDMTRSDVNGKEGAGGFIAFNVGLLSCMILHVTILPSI